MKKILFALVISLTLFIVPSLTFAASWSIGGSGDKIKIDYSSGGGNQGGSSFDDVFDSVNNGKTLPGGEFELPAPEEYNTIGENTSIREFIQKVLNFVLSFLGLIAIIAIIYAGYLYILAGGDDGKIESAKKIIIYAVIGLIVVVISYALVNTILKEAITGGDDRGVTGSGGSLSSPSNSSLNNNNGSIGGSISGGTSGNFSGSYYQVGSSVKTNFAPGTTIKAGTSLPNGQILATDKVVREDGTIEIETNDITSLNSDDVNTKADKLLSFNNGIVVTSKNGGIVDDKDEYTVITRDAATSGVDFGVSMQAVVKFDFGDGLQGKIDTITNPGETITHSFGLNTSYLVRAISKTADGKIHTFSKNIIIDPTIVDFRISKTNAVVNEIINLTALAKTTIGEIKNYKWSCSSDNSGCFEPIEGESVSATFQTPGIYTITLSVGNTVGTETSVSKEVTIQGEPTASFKFRSTGNPQKPMEYEFSAEDSRSSKGTTDNIQYEWTFEGTKKVTTTPNLTYSFSKEGKQEVLLQIVESGQGKKMRSQISSATVDVKASLNPDFSIYQ